MRVSAAAVRHNADRTAFAPQRGELLLAYFDAPALLQNGEQLLTVPPQNLLLCRADDRMMCRDIAKQAAFAVCFDAQDTLSAALPLDRLIAMTATDPPPTATQLCGLAEQLEAVLHSAMTEALQQAVCAHLLQALLAMRNAIVQYRQNDVERRHNRAGLIALRQEIYCEPAQNWSIGQMCVQVSVSRTHLHRIYQETFDTPCHTDVLQSRLLRAGHMLVTTDRSVREIALACGFENDITFMRAFKKHKNCTPTTYRKQYATSSECTSDSFGFVDIAEISP